MDYKEHLIIAGKLTLICFCAVLLLSIVNLITAGPIKINEQKEENKANAALFPKGEKFVRKSFGDEAIDDNKEYYYQVFDSSGEVLGYVVSVLSSGYGGELKVMVALGTDLEVISMKLMKNNETPGIGKNAEKDAYMVKFQGTNTPEKPFPRSKSDLAPEDKDAVTGATITFNAVKEAGLRAITLLKEEI